MDEKLVREVDVRFRQYGLGLIYAHMLGPCDPKVTTCVASIPHDDVKDIMAGVAGLASQRPLECPNLLAGDILVEGDSRMDDLVLWAGATIGGPLPMIVVCVAENMFAAYAKGSAPMVTYLATRTAVSSELDPFHPGQSN